MPEVFFFGLLLILSGNSPPISSVLSTPLGYSHDQRPSNKSRGISDDVIGHMALLFIFLKMAIVTCNL